MKFTDEDLVLYADGSLSVERKQRLVQAAEHDAELASTLKALDASQLPYKASFAQKELPPVPEQLREDIHNLVRVASNSAESRATVDPVRRVWSVRFAQAAGLVLCVGVGYLAGLGQEQDSAVVAGNRLVATASIDQTATQLEWVKRVTDYQSLYVPNTVKNIKADLPASIEKLSILAKATGVRSAIPDLTGAGYEFTRAQELGYEGKPLVQLVYSKEGYPPLALCFMAADGDDDTQLHVAYYRGLGAASWVQGNQRFVLVADEPSEALEELYVAASASFPEV